MCQKKMLFLLVTICAFFGCGEKSKSTNAPEASQVGPTAESMAGIWLSEDKDTYLILSPTDSTSAKDEGRYCRFSGLKDIDWESPESYENAHIEFGRGSSLLEGTSKKAEHKNLMFEMEVDTCAGTSAALGETPVQDVNVATTRLKFDSQNLDKLADASLKSYGVTILRLLKLLNTAQLGCNIDGKFVETKSVGPNC